MTPPSKLINTTANKYSASPVKIDTIQDLILFLINRMKNLQARINLTINNCNRKFNKIIMVRSNHIHIHQHPLLFMTAVAVAQKHIYFIAKKASPTVKIW